MHTPKKAISLYLESVILPSITLFLVHYFSWGDAILSLIVYLAIENTMIYHGKCDIYNTILFRIMHLPCPVISIELPVNT